MHGLAVRGRGDAPRWRKAASGRAGGHLRAARAERRAKTDKADAQLLRELLAAWRIPECYIPPTPVLEWRALLELYHDLRIEHTAWAQRIHATCFHQGTTTVGEAGVIRGSRAGLESIVDEQLSPVGRLQVNTALSVMDTLAEHLDRLRRRLVPRPGTSTAPGC